MAVGMGVRWLAATRTTTKLALGMLHVARVSTAVCPGFIPAVVLGGSQSAGLSVALCGFLENVIWSLLDVLSR